jgi:hypothetical protein
MQTAVFFPPVDNPLREIVLEIFEDGTLFFEAHKYELGRSLPLRARDIDDFAVAILNPEELEERRLPWHHIAVQTEHHAALRSEPALLHLDLSRPPGPLTRHEGEIV